MDDVLTICACLPPLLHRCRRFPPLPLAAEGRGYRTAHYQLTRGSVGCYLSHLRLYQHVLRGGAQFALVFEDDAAIAPPGNLLASLIDLKPFPGAGGGGGGYGVGAGKLGGWEAERRATHA